MTKKALIKSAAARYAATFQRRNEWITDRDMSHEKAIHVALEALPPNATHDEISRIVGHDRLTRNICHQCGVDSDVTVLFGQEPHHPLDTRPICVNCLQQALAAAMQD